MAARVGLLRRRAGLGRVVRTRLSLPRLVGDGAQGSRRDPAVVPGVDRAASAIRLVLLRRGVLHRALARLSALSLQFDLADDRDTRPQQSRGGIADDLACRTILKAARQPLRKFASRSSAPCRMKIAACSS